MTVAAHDAHRHGAAGCSSELAGQGKQRAGHWVDKGDARAAWGKNGARRGMANDLAIADAQPLPAANKGRQVRHDVAMAERKRLAGADIAGGTAPPARRAFHRKAFARLRQELPRRRLAFRRAGRRRLQADQPKTSVASNPAFDPPPGDFIMPKEGGRRVLLIVVVGVFATGLLPKRTRGGLRRKVADASARRSLCGPSRSAWAALAGTWQRSAPRWWLALPLLCDSSHKQLRTGLNPLAVLCRRSR